MAEIVNSESERDRSAATHRSRRTAALDAKRAALHVWQDRVRNPSLTVLLIFQILQLFIALPLEASGVPMAQVIGLSLLLPVLTLVVILSHRAVAIAIIVLGLASTMTSVVLGREWSPVIANALNRGGLVFAFGALVWVVAHAVYAPGRITFHRLQGAVVLYLSLATMFAAAFCFLWELVPGAFDHLAPMPRGPREFATMFYFSLTTLTTIGYGDIVPLNPFARSLANVEAVIGQFYLAITVTRLVTLEMADRQHNRR